MLRNITNTGKKTTTITKKIAVIYLNIWWHNKYGKELWNTSYIVEIVLN